MKGQRLHINIRPGDGTRPPLLLMNGVGTNLEAFQPFVDALDPAIEVIRFDVPGVGGSPVPALPYRLPMLAGLVAQMLDQLGYGQVDVLGVSWGGGLAQQFTLQYGRRCRRLVLVSTSTGTLMVPGDPRMLQKMATPRRHHDRAYMSGIAAELYGGSARSQPELLDHYVPGAHTPVSMQGYVFQMLATMGWTSLPIIPHTPESLPMIADLVGEGASYE